MNLSRKVLPLVMLSMFSFHSFGSENGCLERMNEKFQSAKNLKTELNNDSTNKLKKMLLPSYIPGALLGIPGLATAFFSIYITGVVDQVEIHQMIKTASILEISDKFVNNKQINSEDYYKLGVFYKLKNKIEKKLKSKRSISDQDLAKIISDENLKPIDQNIFCSTTVGGNFVISKLNGKLIKKIMTSLGEADGDISDDEVILDEEN